MILITGGGGFIGLSTARELVDMGQEVLLVRRHPFQLPSFLNQYADKQVKIVLGDIGELPFLYRVIREYNVDSIIHLAMIREGLGSLYQVLKTNVEDTTEILEAARVFSLQRVTFCSSIAVYQVISKPQFLQEDMDLPVKSRGYVSATKKIGEQICQLYSKEYGLSVPSVRPSQVWGPMYWSGLQPIQLMVENAVAGKPTDFSNVCGLTKGHHVYVRDCARAISLVHLAPSLRHDIYNITEGTLHGLADFADAIKEVIPKAEIKLGMNRSEQDVDLPSMSIEQIKEDVGFIPQYDLKRAVRSYIDWVRDVKYT